MKCEEYQEQLLSYLDHQLASSAEIDLAKHLQTCAACTGEFEELKNFNRSVHNATIPFREASDRIRSRAAVAEELNRVGTFRKVLAPAWIAIAAVFIILVYFVSAPKTSDVEQLASWGIEHYPLLDQAHAVSGNAATVRLWFQEHHHIDVTPPQGVNYSELTGCKMTQLNSQQVPLLRFVGKQEKAVFILPSFAAKSWNARRAQTFLRHGFQIELWTEGNTSYMALTRQNI